MIEAMEGLAPAIKFVASAGCPLGCHSERRKFAEAYGSGRYGRDIFTIWQCSSCGVGFTDPVPAEEDSHRLYETRESNDFQPGDSSFVSRLKALAARRDALAFCRGANPRGRFLDYGCGNGAFASAIQQVFPEGRAIGSDLHPEPPAFLDKDSYLPYGELRPGSFDFALCRHVLEHTYRPTEFLLRIKRLLKPGGILAIEVPSLDAWVRHLFGRRWDGWYVPFHPVHFTRGSLARAVESAGLRVTREGSAEMPKMGRSLRNVLGGEYNALFFGAGLALQPIQVAVGLATGTAACLRVWAEAPL